MNPRDLKFVLLGHKNVGKTSLFNRYIYNEFAGTDMTIGAYFGLKNTRVDGIDYKLYIWDTAGEEKFDSLTSFYCRNTNAALICYDITTPNTFSGLPHWVDKIMTETEDCSIVLVGMKLDLVEANPELRRVTLAEAQKYANTIGAECYEASAKTGHNISTIVEAMVRSCALKQSNMGPANGNGNGAFPPTAPPKKKTGCCK